jgi:hypothetical protein
MRPLEPVNSKKPSHQRFSQITSCAKVKAIQVQDGRMMQCWRRFASPWRRILPKNVNSATKHALLVYLLCFNGAVRGEFDSADSIHHLFNAHLLQPKEFQVSVYGNAQAGITPDLELGLQGLAYVIQPPLWNFSLKHRMFTTSNFQTSFNSHSFFFTSGDERLLLSLHGVITSYKITSHQHLNFGLMDGLVMSFSRDGGSSLHLVTPMIGWDGVINRHVAFSATLLRPIYASEEQESQRFGEGNREIDFTSGKAKPAFGMTTMIFSWRTFHFEVGAIYLSYENALALPYANLFWRFPIQ